MDDDQQFCLRWNNHQSTLISVFDTLLENGTLVDCTLAAEGQFLKAHKVVLSACSPYFASLLSQQYDKHPIFILKDVKFQELRAMMDYMYRGEVNISQDQLAALLKAAESLQIKGLSDSRGGSSGTNVGTSSGGQKQPINEHKQLPVSVTTPPKSSGISSGYTIEQKRPRHAIGALSIDSQELAGSREGSSSPTSRKRKKIRRRSLDNIMNDNHDHSNSSSHSMQFVNCPTASVNTSAAIGSVTAAAASASSTSTVAAAISGSAAAGLNITKKTDNSKMESGVEEDLDNDGAVDHRDQQHQENNKPIAELKKEQNHKRKSQLVDTDNGKDNSDLLIEPKNEYDDGNDETVEDLTLDEEELLEDLEQAGPSHGGEGSSQGYAQWQVDRSQDEVFLAAQEAAGQQRDPQDLRTTAYNVQGLSSSGIYEPEVTIRKLYKCCAVGMTCSGCTISPPTVQQLLPSFLTSNSSSAVMVMALSTPSGPSSIVPPPPSLSSSSPKFNATIPSSSSSLPAKKNSVFECIYCPFSSTWKYDLKLHLRQKHGIHKKM